MQNHMKPYILLPMPEINPESGLGRTYAMRRTYAELALARGYAPVGIPSNAAFADIEALYEGAAGILLMGGSDINPEYYGEAVEGSLAPFDSGRDALEAELVRRSAIDKKPLIGICRGAQMIAVALGGTLNQDIAALAQGEIHAPALNRYEDILTKEDQPLRLEADSRLAAIIGATEIHGPCAHHQSIKALPASLRVAARSAAGIIEAVEAVDPEWYCFGLQSHYETRGGGDMKALFEWK